MMVRLHRITKEGCSCHVRDFCRIVCRSSETDILTPVTDNTENLRLEKHDQHTVSILNILVYNRLPSALFDIRDPVRDVRKWFCFYTVNCGEIVSILDTIDDFNITHQKWEHGASGVMCLGFHWHSVCTFLIIWMTQHHHHSWQDSCPSFSVYSQHVLWSHQTSFLQVHGDDDNDDEQNHDDDDDDTVHQWEWNLQRIRTVQVKNLRRYNQQQMFLASFQIFFTTTGPERWTVIL